MEIREQVLRALERKRDMQESSIRQARIALNLQATAQKDTHREKLKTFSQLKQALLKERCNIRVPARELMQNIITMRKKLAFQEREILSSSALLDSINKREQQLIAQHARVSQQKRMVQKFAGTQYLGAIRRAEEREIEEMNATAILSKDQELDEVAAANSASLYVSVPEHKSLEPDLAGNMGFESLNNRPSISRQYQGENDGAQYQRTESNPDSLYSIEADGGAPRNQASSQEDDADPKLSFSIEDLHGRSVAVALRLRNERGIEVMLQRSTPQTSMQSQHEARRIERSLNASGLVVAGVMISDRAEED